MSLQFYTLQSQPSNKQAPPLCAKKIVSGNPGLVNFTFGILNSVLCLPNSIIIKRVNYILN